MRGDEIAEQLFAFARLEVDDLHAAFAQPVDAARKVRDSPTTTVPMRNCTTRPLQYQHGASVVDHDGVAIIALASGLAERVCLAMHGGIGLLHAAIVAAPNNRAVIAEQRRADRDAAFGQSRRASAIATSSIAR